jgi:hypothetical protein
MMVVLVLWCWRCGGDSGSVGGVVVVVVEKLSSSQVVGKLFLK